MVATQIDRTLRGIGNFVFYDEVNDKTLNLQKGINFSISHNPVQRRIPTTSSSGYSTFGDNFTVGYDYRFTMSQVVMQPEILQFRLANVFASVSNKVYKMPINLEVYNTTIPAVTSGQFGYNIAEDATAQMSKTVANLSVPLTKVAYSSFDAGTDDTYAIGANGELRFATNLVTARARVAGFIEYTVVSGLEYTSTPTSTFQVYATVVTTDNEVCVLNIPRVKPDYDGAAYNPTAESVDLPFFLVDVAGRNVPYDLIYTGEVIS